MKIYYNRLMGPACSLAVNATVTPDYAQMILDIVNRIRSKVARGVAKGGDGVDLPRGYGIYRLEWDEELATFAQLWANQCMMKNDLCRATKKFPTAGQTIGMSRFTVDEWKPINSPAYSNTTTLTPDKVKYAITSVLKAWYDMKKDVYHDVINQADIRSSKMLRNQFLHLIYGDVTHIGCGISAYREYAYYDNNAALNYNSVQIVCNYSSRPQSGEVYTRDPPTKSGYTVRCGCPLGYDEDEDCLCYASGRKLPYTCKDNKSRCKPAVVVLPIFMVENAPLELQKIGSNATLLMNTNEIFDHYDLLNKRKQDQSGMFNDYQSSNRKSDASVKRYPVDVKKRYFNTFRSRKNLQHNIKPSNNSSSVGVKRRSKLSVFSKYPIFELSLRKTSPFMSKKNINVYKIDVTPRKDFSKVRKLVSKYLDKKRSGNPINLDMNNGFMPHDAIFDPYNKSNSLQGAKEINNDVENFTEKTIDKFNLTDYLKIENIKTFKEDADHKLIKLLDTLEKEVKEIEFNTNERKMFNDKIRKIYSILIDKPDLNRIWNNDSKGSKQESNKIYGRKYLESLNPSDILKMPSKSDKLNRNLSGENFNKNIMKMPFNFDDIENRIRSVYDVREDSERNRHFDNVYLKNRDDEDLLNSDRRRYYDNKLEKLRRKIDLMKRNGYQNDRSRKLRPVRPTKTIGERRRRPKATEPFYVPDRARFLHGF